MKTPQEIARSVSALMEDLSEYINHSDRERAKAGLTLNTEEARVRNVLCQLYEPMIKWKFEVERMSQ